MKLAHVLATIERGAVGNHALGINAALKSHGIDVEMFAETIRPEFVDTVSNMPELVKKLTPHDTVLYQFANPSPIADVLVESGCRLFLNYHNITPARYFSTWNPVTAAAVSRARAQLARLAPLCSGAVAVSHYNAAELIDLGYRNVEVIPPVFEEQFHLSRDETRAQPQSSWLYVGRIAPHKNIDVLLHAFEIYRQRHDESAQLTIVGSTDTPLYGRAITELIHDRNLTAAVKMIEYATPTELLEAYKQASVFVLASEHEGFCVPIIEAMASGVPVVCINASAIPETTGSAAIVVGTPDPSLLCDAAARLEKDPQLYHDYVQRGHQRSALFDPAMSAQKYVEYIEGILS